MAKKKRSPNPNLKYSQASKRDEGKKNLEGHSSLEGEAEANLGTFPVTEIATPSPSNQGGSFNQASVMEESGNKAARIGRNQRHQLSKTLTSDLLEAKEATSGNKLEETGATSAASSPHGEASGSPAQVNASSTTNTSQNGMLSGIVPITGAINSKGSKLKYFPPVIKQGVLTVQLQPPELENEAMKWKYAMVLYVIGIKPCYNAIRKYVCHLWQNIAEPKIFLHNDGYFIVRFNCNVIDKIVSNGPYLFAGKPVVVKPWHTGFDFQAEVNRCVPVWVRFPSLPLPCWSENSLSRLGSALGIPICLDKCTTQQLRISYARMLIEIDVTRPLDSSLMVDGGQDQPFEQRVIYEWVPHFCSKCCQVGHNCELKATGGKKKKKSKSKRKMIWVEKTHKEEEKDTKEKESEAIEEEGVNEGVQETSPSTPLDAEAAGAVGQQGTKVAAPPKHPLHCSSSSTMRQQLVPGSSSSQKQQEVPAAEHKAVQPSDPMWPDLTNDRRL